MPEERDTKTVYTLEWIAPIRTRCNPFQIEDTTQTDSIEYDSLELKKDLEALRTSVPKENVTVKFRISETQVIAQIYPNHLTIEDIKRDIANKFEVQAERLILKQCKQEMQDEWLLTDTGCDQFGIYEFWLELKTIAGAMKEQLNLDVYYAKHRLPDFITVRIPADEEREAYDIIVEIQNQAILKPFLCGYKNKISGVEYLDAFTQTGPYFDKWKYRRYVSRDTQTYEIKENSINTAHDQMSQCWQDGNNVRYVSAATDYFIKPGKYITAAQKERQENKLAKIILIQRNWRRFLIVRHMKNAAAEYRRLVANRNADDEKFEQERLIRMEREKRAKEFPHKRADFELLHSELQKWKMAELKRITSMYEGPARIAEIYILLDKEIQLLNGLERQRNLVHKAMEDFRNEQLLKKLGEPVTWIGYKGKVVHMDLIRTQRCRFLSEIYKDLQQPLEKEDRIELLHKVKKILLSEKEFPEFPQLFDLIQREINLLMHTQYCDVEILRKRQNMHFMELIKYSKEYKPEKQGTRLCLVCKEVKPFDQFALHTRQNNVDTCKRCAQIKRMPTNPTAYTAILRSVQRDERKRRCTASFAFVMQVDDIRHIVDQIWHSHSILSKNANISDLRLPRWIKSEDWSPWNCICLTDSEARDHYRIEDLSVYDKKMILEVGNRHKLGRTAFRNLAAVATEFLETGQWFNVGMNQQRAIPRQEIYPRKEFDPVRTKKFFDNPPEKVCD